MLARWKRFIWCLLFMLVIIGWWWLQNRLRNPLRSAISQTPVLWFFCEIIGELFQSKRRGMIRIRYFQSLFYLCIMLPLPVQPVFPYLTSCTLNLTCIASNQQSCTCNQLGTFYLTSEVMVYSNKHSDNLSLDMRELWVQTSSTCHVQECPHLQNKEGQT